jgi:glycosyltransferase involved in cell wall biosynthesis
MTRPAAVSVVVCAYNESAHIGRLLSSLGRQTYAPSDIVVVDDGSVDDTAAIAERDGATVIRVDHRGPARGRNAGAEFARGDILVFLDGDMACAPTFVDRLTEPIRQGRAVGTFTRDIYVGNAANRWSQAYCYIRRLAFPRLLPEDFPDRSAHYRAVRRDRFLEVGGYDDVGYGEDMTLAPKLGALAHVADGAVCFHFNPETPGEIFENARWIGRGHDVAFARRPVRENLPMIAFARGLADVWRGAPPVTVVARLVYSTGFLLGCASRRRTPMRHWK